MSRLIANSTPAERAVSCSFAERNRSPSEVVENGGTLVDSPTFDSDGIVLDGSTQYVSYDFTGNEFNSSELSIVCEFWPDFEVDEDVTRYMYDTTSGKRHYVFKANNASNNILAVNYNGQRLANVSEAAYAPYWIRNKRNILQISSVSGSTSVWLNKQKIVNGAGTIWTPTSVFDLYMGSNLLGAENFKGKIGQFKVFKSLLTEQDAINFYDNTTYTYPQRALIDLPMQACQHDPDNVRTLDISSNGNHATFGDGVTASTYPTKLQKRGYYFNNSNWLLTAPLTLPNTTKCTFACIIENPNLEATDYFMAVSSAGEVDIFGLLFMVAGEIWFYTGATGATKRATYQLTRSGKHAIVGLHDGVDTKLIVDGIPGVDASAPVSPEITGVQSASFGSNLATGSRFLGNILEAQIWPIALTPLQIADWHFNALKRINRV
jgi:hypothetical protein